MFSILLSIPRASRHSNPNEVSWESVDSHFSDLFSEDFICAIKPFNGDHTLAKVYFKKKVIFGSRSDEFLINNSVPAKVVERKEESNLPSALSRTIDLQRSFTDAQLLEIKVDLEEQYRLEFRHSDATSDTRVTLHACHPDVLDSAELALRKWASQQRGGGAQSPASAAASVVPKPRRMLFPMAAEADAGDHQRHQAAAAAAAPAAAYSEAQFQSADLGGPYDFELRLNPNCRLRVQPHDITALQCDLLVVPTSCALSLNYGLARVSAAKAGRPVLQQQCRARIAQLGGNLKFGDTHLVAAPPGSQLPARHLLYVALPNDRRLTETVDAGQFKAVMRDIVASLLRVIVDLSTSPTCRVRSVAMTPVGASLPYWADQSEDFAHVLAEALWDARDGTGDLGCISVCDLQLETLATLGRVLAARFGSTSISSAAFSALPSNRRRQQAAAPSAASASASASAAAEGGGDVDCELCCETLTAGNPGANFHCNRGRLCSACVRRLQDPDSPGNGRCPMCQGRYRPARGSQPAGGSMTVTAEASSLPGHEGHATLVVTYTFGPGVQGSGHPNPGLPYRGASRVTYFPDSPDGRAIVQRLRLAFDSRAVFTVGTSATTGMENTVTWATVHHKTNTSGGPERHGYPDPTYLKRISDELEALGY